MPSKPRETFGQDVLDDLRTILRDAPDPPADKPSEYSKRELVRHLAPTIRELAKRGWSHKAIAQLMSQRVGISADLLQAYLRNRSRPARKGKAKPETPPTEAPATSFTPTPPATASPARPQVSSIPSGDVRRAPAPRPEPRSPVRPPVISPTAVDELLADEQWVSDEATTGPVGPS